MSSYQPLGDKCNLESFYVPFVRIVAKNTFKKILIYIEQNQSPISVIYVS